MKRLAFLGGVVVWALTAATVLATPGSGVVALDLARGTVAAPYTITHTANRDIMTQSLTFAPGATTGWHTHPGSVVVIVESGTLSFWDSTDCVLETYTAGQALVVPGGSVFDLARNDQAVPLELVVTYYNVPVGGAQTIGSAAQCTSATPAVPQDVGASNITAVTLSRTRLSAAINEAGPANTDLLIQQLTFAPASTTGWHRHPGALTVAVESGELLFTHADCRTERYPAGTAQYDPGVVHVATSAGASVAFVTYTNLPVGGPARIDEPAPACAAAAATTAPAASSLPNTSAQAVAADASAPGLLALTVLLAIGSAGVLVWRRRST